MMLKNGRDWQPEIIDLTVWRKAYPNINIETELRKMESWCYSNPSKRKTPSGVKKFINSWLARSTPTPIAIRSRDTSLQDDLNDRSWA